jgi:hypothetical protein
MFAQWDNLFFGFTTVYQGFFLKNWEPEQASTQYYIVA